MLATSGTKSGVGLYQIVSINGGSNQGLKPGHVFSAFSKGEKVDGHARAIATAVSPRTPMSGCRTCTTALVMVFRTFGDISYGLVMSGTRVVEEFDSLRHPDERL